uniref:Uncharacterized protein n=1 Tax=Cacopsylla melanoneura TaxID=428564 RepID=A0A8D9AZ92_9HEMI
MGDVGCSASLCILLGGCFFTKLSESPSATSNATGDCGMGVILPLKASGAGCTAVDPPQPIAIFETKVSSISEYEMKTLNKFIKTICNGFPKVSTHDGNVRGN